MGAQGLGVPPGEALDRLQHGDPQMAFAVAAATEQHNREVERWNNLYKMLKQLAELWSK